MPRNLGARAQVGESLKRGLVSERLARDGTGMDAHKLVIVYLSGKGLLSLVTPIRIRVSDNLEEHF